MGSSGWFLDRRLKAMWPFAVERDAPGALASARAAPDKLITNLTLSSAERRRFAARTGATISVAREQELTRESMTKIAAQRKRVCSHVEILKKAIENPAFSETAAAALSLSHG